MHDFEDQVGRQLIRLSDTLVLVLSLLLALGIHPWLATQFPKLPSLARWQDFLIVPCLFAPLWWFTLSWTGADKFLSSHATRASVLLDLAKVQFFSSLGLVALLWFGKILVNRTVLLLAFAIGFSILLALRLALLEWKSFRTRSGAGRMKVLIFGADEDQSTENELRSTKNAPSVAPPPLIKEHPEEALAKALHERAVDRVLLVSPYDSLESARPLIELCESHGIPALFQIPNDSSGNREARLVQMQGVSALAYVEPEKSSFQLALKQLLDTLGAFLGVLLISPLLLLIILLLLISDGRPIFFSQERIGLRGRRFPMLKFRTMVKDAEERQKELADQNEAEGPVFKVKHDPRITPLGRFLRRSSLDELPQLLNVLAGDMSLIGPRPLPSKEQQGIHGRLRRRLAMKPGITGLWQVSGRSNISFEQWMELDLKYVDTWSLWLDCKILLKTVPAVIAGRGAH